MQPTPNNSFMRDLKSLDRRLGIKFNGTNFVITYDRGYGEPVNLHRVRDEVNGGFRQPDGRDLNVIKKGDLASGESLATRLEKSAYDSYQMREHLRRKSKENIRDMTKDDKHYLMNKIGRVAGQGKPRPAFRPITPKRGKNVVMVAK